MKIKFKWIGAACFVMEIDDQFKIACDPCLSPIGAKFDFKYFKSERTIGPEYEDNDFRGIDLWLLTHNHEDHLDGDGLAVLDKDSVKLCHKNVVRKLAEAGMNRIDSVTWGEYRTFTKDRLEVSIRAVPAVHGSNFLASYFAGGVNGYWLEAKKGSETKSIYITGDTICHPTVEKFIGNKICDILIPNMGAVKEKFFGGPLTMNNKMLVHLIDCLEPLAVLPVHYGDFSHYSGGFPELDLHHKTIVKRTKRGKEIELAI